MVHSFQYRFGLFVRHCKVQDWLAVVFLTSLVLLFFWRIVFLGQVLLPADMIYTAEPWKSEATPKLTGTPWNTDITDVIWQLYPMAVNANLMHREGYFFWDPYPMAGMPALARGEMFANPILM